MPQSEKREVKLYDGLDAASIEELVFVSDADGTYTMFEDKGMYEAAQYVEDNYFN